MTPHQKNNAAVNLLRYMRIKPERHPLPEGGDYRPNDPPKRPPEWHIRRMAKALGSTYELVVGHSHRHDISMVRQVIAYQLRVKHGMTLQAVGDALDREHATISYAVKVVEGLVEIGDRRVLEMTGKL